MTEESKENLKEEINKKRNKKSYIGITLILALLLLGGGSYFYFYAAGDAIADEVPEVERERPLVAAAPVKTMNLEKTASIVGYTKPNDTIAIVPQIPGEVEEIYVEEGERVEKGQELMRVEDDDYRLQYEEATYARDMAQAQLDEAEAGPRDSEVTEVETNLNMAKDQKEQAKKEYERIEALHEEGYVSEQDLEQAELQYRNAKEQVEAAEAALDAVKEGAREEQIRALRAQVNQADVGVRLARRNLDRATVEAPGSGTITGLELSEGDMADTASPAMILIDTETVTVNAGLPEIYVNQVSEGQEVKVEIPAVSEKPYKNTIHKVGELPPENGRGYPVEVVISNRGGVIYGGMFSRIELIVEIRDNVLAIPRQAIIEEGDDLGVYVVEKTRTRNTVEFRSVETGISDDGMVEVVDGLIQGEKVIIDGQGEVGPGDEVRLDN